MKIHHSLFVIRLTLVAFSIVFGIAAVVLWPSSDPNLHFNAVASLVCSVALWLPLLLMHIFKTTDVTSPRAQVVAEFSWTLMLTINALGAIHFYYTWRYYDAVLHFCFPILGALLLSILIMGIFERFKRYDLWMVRWTALGLSAVFILAWEVFEYVGDKFFHTDMHSQIGERYDTIYDVALGYAGLVIAYKVIEWALPRLRR
jgi:hypothetical protein